MDIRFGVYFTRSLGTLYKDNEIDSEGMEGKVDLDLKEVSTLTVTFKVGEVSFTDSVTIKDIENGLIQIPFKNDVVKQGLNSFEIVAIMKNGDVKASQTYTYYIEKSLENPNSIEAETNYPVLITLINNVQNALDAENIRILNEEDRQVLKGQVELLKTNLESLEVDLNTLEGTIETNESTRQSNEEARQLLKDSMSTLKSNLESLQADLNTLEDNVETNESTRQTNEEARGITFTSKINAIDTKMVEAGVTIDNTNIAKNNAITATTNATNKITETEATRQSIITTINNLVTQFNALAPANSTNAEVQLARTDVTGKTYASLQERLLADNKQQNILYSSVSGTYITSDSVDRYAKNVVIEGNTYQNPALLSDIRSTGTKLVDGRFEIPLLCMNKNIDGGIEVVDKYYSYDKGTAQSASGINGHKSRVYPNKSYALTNVHSNITFWTKDMAFISGLVSATTITTPANCYYIRYAVQNTKTNLVQIEDGTVATSYELPQSHKLTILSDYQIEKVGTVADRIVEKDGVWCIEKNVSTVALNGSESGWQFAVDSNGQVNTIRFYCPFSYINKTDIISSAFVKALNYGLLRDGDTEGISVNDVPVVGSRSLQIRISKTKATDLTTFKALLNTNNLLVKYQLDIPQYIPLPDDQQVALRTFNNKTNILSLCEIEPTIKCEVPKSTSASINGITNHLDNVDEQLEKIKKLEDATTSTVITDNSFVGISDTGNGYLSDVKLEGITLNQLVKNGNFANGSTGWSGISATISTSNNIATVTGNGTHSQAWLSDVTPTIKGAINKKVFIRASLKVTNSVATSMQIYLNDGVSNFVIATQNTPVQNTVYNLYGVATLNSINDFKIYLYHKYADATTQNGKVMEVQNVMALDLTDLGMTNYTADQVNSMLNGYFEGLKSVGQDATKIVVSSVKGDGNLCPKNFTLGALDSSGVIQSNTTNLCIADYIRVSESTNYKIKDNTNTVTMTTISQYDANKKFISNLITSGFTTSVGCKYLRFSENITGTVNLDANIQLEKGTVATSYKSIETDKKEILYLDTVDSTWKKPVFRGIWSNGSLVVGDTVDKHSDGKYYYHKRIGEVVLNGSEIGWALEKTLTNTLIFTTTPSNPAKVDISGNTIYTMSDVFAGKTQADLWASDIEGCSTSSNISGKIRISILKFKLATQDVAGLKTRLASSNVTIAYQLATELVYECTPIDVASFDSETNYYLESGVLSPRSTIKVTNYIGNVLNTLKEKVSKLEDIVYQTNMATFVIGLNVLNKQ